MPHNVFTWLLMPLSGASEHHIATWVAWHGRLMVVSWAVLLPTGVLAARYFKVLPQQSWPAELDNKTWWHAHQTFQWGGVLLMTAGLILAWCNAPGASSLARAHGTLGWCIGAAGWLQIAGGLARGTKGGPSDQRHRDHRSCGSLRGDHYDMTPRRVAFELVHKVLGTSAILAALLAIATGLVVADAPRWMALVLTSWVCLLGVLVVRWQRQGRCVDTYQAIWGPDVAHPGNQKQPIGYGIHRYTARTWKRRWRTQRHD
ncbi:cytochrome b561 domain-containing protein [Paraburkholderia nemoris]|uniref:cytochrome b561 domain-containing protein n=1 Tax=Paraburkholderia nemoris TaxID=2793076 RepID=UPI0038B762B7